MDQPPASPGGEGPTKAPPHLPPGWIAQWDANSKKYYYVQLSTGESQWDVPTSPAPVGGGTPAPVAEHPYGAPGGGQPELITHPDGSQTVKHADGRLEPVMPDENGNARGMREASTGDRGVASSLLSAALGGGGKQSGGGHGVSSTNLGGLANQVFSGLTHSGSGNAPAGHGSSAGGGFGGKLAAQLASNLFSSGSKPAPSNFHSGQQQPQHHSSGGLAGSVMGGVANMLGGHSNGSQHANYNYSNSGQQGTYSGGAPAATYQQSLGSQQGNAYNPQGSHPSSYHAPAGNAPQHPAQGYSARQQHSSSYGNQPQQHGAPPYPPPPSGGGYGGSFSQEYQGSVPHAGYSQSNQLPGPPSGHLSQQPFRSGSASQYGHSQHGGGYNQPSSSFGGPHGSHGSHHTQSQGQYFSVPSYGSGPAVSHVNQHAYGNNQH